MMSGRQIRGARAMLSWSGKRLADESGVSYPAIQRAEKENGLPNMQTRNLAAIRDAFERHGISFLTDSKDSEGVLFKEIL